MDTLTFLQNYWWFLIALLGALLVFLLFVQGGQALLYVLGRSDEERNLVINAMGRKWEFTFTTLVTFGGAFFASFPFFYSTSFGGAFYVWMAILLCFVLQAVAYEYRRKPANLLGEKTFNAFLLINGILGPLLLGTAVSTLFTGAPFTVDRLNLAHAAANGSVVISQWATPWHGLDALANGWNLVLGIAVTLLAMMLACQYFMNSVDDELFVERARKRMLLFAVGFVVCFVAWLVRLLFATGYAADPTTGTIAAEPYKYLHNLLEMPYVTVVLLLGVVSVLWSIWLGWCGNRRAIWPGGIGTVLAVLALLLCAGWNNTAYYPSLADMQSSLTIRNSSSSLFTLRAMAYVSLLIPFVAAYIWYAWRAINRRPLTKEELKEGGHQY
ncbi:MAG: cytochrome d ubiquinol oxidase subunit II [Alistipes sp.]|nr:cytochrome d ubiquinol oxidase subunit II [Alistipes senegalensis]MCM1250688.1 cytochrome d ubiquinol oxidase subunit II [Alistipes sp.]